VVNPRNSFAYIVNAPVNGVDPGGLQEFPTSCVGAVIASGSADDGSGQGGGRRPRRAARSRIEYVCQVVCHCPDKKVVTFDVPLGSSRFPDVYEQACNEIAEESLGMRLCTDDRWPPDRPFLPIIDPSPPGIERPPIERPVQRPDRVRLPRLPSPEPEWQIAPCVVAGVGVAIIIVDIITIPSGEGAIGFAMCAKAFAG